MINDQYDQYCLFVEVVVYLQPGTQPVWEPVRHQSPLLLEDCSLHEKNRLTVSKQKMVSTPCIIAQTSSVRARMTIRLEQKPPKKEFFNTPSGRYICAITTLCYSNL